MKKILLLLLSASVVFAGWYNKQPSLNQEPPEKQCQQPQRGMETPRTDDYLDNQIDKNNSNQDSASIKL